MIDSRELRIGNWVTDQFFDTFKTFIKVDSINNKGINLEIEDDGKWSEIAQTWIGCEYRFESLFGIPLTEEILLKCGFEKYNHTNYESGYIIEHKEPSKCVYIRTSLKPTSSVFFAVFNRSECNKNEIQFIKKIEYIHDLQNIYKLLTNEELTIQL